MIGRLAVLLTVLVTAGCAEVAAPAPAGHAWHDGRLFMATGNTTGVTIPSGTLTSYKNNQINGNTGGEPVLTQVNFD